MLWGITIKDWVPLIAAVIGIFLIPFTLLGIWRNRAISLESDNWRARQDEIGTYNDINNKYADFLKLLLSNPDVDIGEFGPPKEPTTEAERYKRKIIYATLVALMERAFLLYSAVEEFEKTRKMPRRSATLLVAFLDKADRMCFGSHPMRSETHIFQKQWPGWVKYFEAYCGQKAFQEYWQDTAAPHAPPTHWHDKDFEDFINKLIQSRNATLNA